MSVLNSGRALKSSKGIVKYLSVELSILKPNILQRNMDKRVFLEASVEDFVTQ